MIQRINDFDIPEFPQIGDADVWMMNIRNNHTIEEMLAEQTLDIVHVSKWSTEYEGSPRFAIQSDAYIHISQPGRPFDTEFGNPVKYHSADFVNTDDDIMFIADNVDELKSIVIALSVMELRQKENTK